MNRRSAATVLFLLASALCSPSLVFSQSSSQEFPTPVVTNEVSAVIKARAVGDPRLTTYYYLLQGEQGDIFLNLVTRNFSGDIDVFTQNGLRPLAKIVVLAEFGESETGRAIYLRRPEKLLLRIQGRTPNDDPASFTFKFAGSFAAMNPDDQRAAPEMPKVSAETAGQVRVSTAGTILPRERETVRPEAETKDEDRADRAKAEAVLPPASAESPEEKAGAEKDTETVPAAKADPKLVTSDGQPPVELVVTETLKTEPEPSTPPANQGKLGRAVAPARPPTRSASRNSKAVVRGSEKKTEETTEALAATPRSDQIVVPSEEKLVVPEEKKDAASADPLAAVTFVIQFKNGTSFEKKMNEVLSFSMNDGVLVVILKNGTTTRYPIAEVARVSIENPSQN